MAWGHPETSGLPTIDYFLTSALMEPEDGDDHYTERLVRLADAYERMWEIYDLPMLPQEWVKRSAAERSEIAAQGRASARGVSSCPCPQYFDPETP